MRRFAEMVVVAVMCLVSSTAYGQLFWRTDGTSGTWTASNWGTSAGGPFTTTWTSGSNAVFNATSTATFATTTVGDVTVADGVTVTVSQAGTLSTGGAARTFTIGSGSTLTWTTQSVSTSASQAGFIKTGSGTWNIGAQSNAYNATNFGFTLNDGTVIVSGNNSFGGTSSVLTINGGTIQSSGTRAYANSSIVIGGDFTNSGTGNATFSGAIALGSANRTITNSLTSGSRIYSGVISSTGTAGLSFAGAGSGETAITNTGNTFIGDITITGGEVRFSANGSLGNASNSITIDGGRFGIASAAGTVDLSSRNIFLGSNAGTEISAPGGLTTILRYDGVLADKTGSTGILVKQGQGILSLGGVSTYTGQTSINNGVLQLTTGNDRLPTGTVLNLGQAGSANLGTLDLNGRNQQVAGLNSTTGINATTANNTITSATAATLTINGGGTYGNGTNENSGVITGVVSVVKAGGATLTLGDANTYSGTTSVNGGTLLVNGNQSAATGDVSVANTATLGGTGTIGGATTVLSGGTLQTGNAGIGTLAFNNNVTIESGGTVRSQISDTASDTINLSGGTSTRNLTYASGSNLNLDATGFTAPSAATTYTLVNLGDAGLNFGTYTGGIGDITTYTNNGTFDTNGVNVTVSGFTFNTGDQLILRRTNTALVLQFSPVPEPTTILGVAVGLVAVGGFIRKRLAKKAVVAA